MAAHIVKAKTIIAVDLNNRRLKLARELGATHSVNNRRTDLAGSVKAITGQGVDYVVESTADSGMEQLAAELLNPGGKAALLSGASAPGRLPGNRQVLSVIQGDAVPQKFIPKLIKLYQAGRFPFDRLVKFYAFAQLNRAIADSKRGSTIKPVLLIGQATTAPSTVPLSLWDGPHWLDRLRGLVMPLQSDFGQQSASHPGDEFRKAALHTVTEQLLPGFGGPKLLL